MIHSNSIAGVSLGAVLVLTALSVPSVRQEHAPRTPHPVATSVRTMDTLSQVVDSQRAEARTFHEDAQRVAALVEPPPAPAPVGTVPQRRAPTRPPLETAHGGRP